MIQKFKTLKKFKSALTHLGYYVGSPEQNGEFRLIKKIISHYDLFFDIGFHKGEISEYVRKINKKIAIFGFDYNINFSKGKKSIFLKKKINTNKLKKIIKFMRSERSNNNIIKFSDKDLRLIIYKSINNLGL